MWRLLLALYLFLPQSLTTPELVDRVSQKYGKLDSFQADFEQISNDSSNQMGRSRGHVYLKKGRRALFQYDTPRKQFEYFDGKYATRYWPELKQAQRYPLGNYADDRLAIFLILGNPGSPWREKFPTMALPKDSPVMSKGNQMAKLIPSPKDKKDIPELLVEVDLSTFLIHRFVSTRADGGRDEFKFTNIKTTPLPDSLFKFDKPPDVDVFEDK